MLDEVDFASIGEPVFFTTSQKGQAGPDIGRETPTLQDAMDVGLVVGPVKVDVRRVSGPGSAQSRTNLKPASG